MMITHAAWMYQMQYTSVSEDRVSTLKYFTINYFLPKKVLVDNKHSV